MALTGLVGAAASAVAAYVRQPVRRSAWWLLWTLRLARTAAAALLPEHFLLLGLLGPPCAVAPDAVSCVTQGAAMFAARDWAAGSAVRPAVRHYAEVNAAQHPVSLLGSNSCDVNASLAERASVAEELGEGTGSVVGFAVAWQLVPASEKRPARPVYSALPFGPVSESSVDEHAGGDCGYAGLLPRPCLPARLYSHSCSQPLGSRMPGSEEDAADRQQEP